MARDGEEGDAYVVGEGQLISFMLPEGKYNAPPPVIGQHLGDPHMAHDLCEGGFSVLVLSQGYLDFTWGKGGDGAVGLIMSLL